MNIKVSIIIEALFLLVLPIMLFALKVLPAMWRYTIMEIALGVLLLLIVKRRIGFKALGLRLDNIKDAIRILLPGTLIILAVIIIMYFFKLGTGLTAGNFWWDAKFFIYYWLIGVFSQQFAFQGYLTRRLKLVTDNRWIIIFVVAILFSYLHSYHASLQVWLGTLLLGAFLTWSYLKVPNLYAVSLAHGIIGTTAILLGFV